MTEIAANPDFQIVITLQPSAQEPDGLLKIDDALRQVLDLLRIAAEGKVSLGRVTEDFDWFLYKASTNSPFQVVASAVPLNPTVDITSHVQAVKSLVAETIERISRGAPPPGWMGPEGVAATREFFRRNTNGVATTVVDFKKVARIEIDQQKAADALPWLEPFGFVAEGSARSAQGEIEGRLIAVGRYYNKPALNLRTTLYGNVWCVLAPHLVEQWADEQKMSAVWKGKRVTVFGRLVYGAGGKLTRIEAENVRERETPRISIESVLDPDFTAGLDPVEYLNQLHEGKLG